MGAVGKLVQGSSIWTSILLRLFRESAEEKHNTKYKGEATVCVSVLFRVIQGVYQMLGVEDAREVEEVFRLMDLDSDGLVTNHSWPHSHVTSCSPLIGQVTEQEFMAACCRDADLMRLLTPSMVQR